MISMIKNKDVFLYQVIRNNGKVQQTKVVGSFLYRYPLFFLFLINIY